MSRTPIAYLNYLRHQVYFNGATDADKSNYGGQVYDITTDLQSIKNYLAIDSTLQRNAFESYPDLTDYYLGIDESQFVRDQTVIEITDIYFSDISDTTRYDSSILLFTLEELIYDYTRTDTSAILHFKIQVNKFADITDFQTYSFPLFLTPNMNWIANDLIVQFDVNFVTVNFFTEHSLLMTLKEYLEKQYVTVLNDKLKLNFLGQNYVKLIDYASMLNTMIIDNLTDAIGKEQRDIRSDMVKWYVHDCSTTLKLTQSFDTNKIIQLFRTEILDVYTNHIDQTIDQTAGFSTDTDLYNVVCSKRRFVEGGDYFNDYLDVNFLRFLLVRNNIYNQKLTILNDGTEFQSDLIKFKVKNVIPNQTYDFTFIQNGFDIDITTIHHTDIPLKIDILEYSSNLIQAGRTPFSNFINNYYFTGFELNFRANKLNTNYGYNSLRIWVSDSFSEVSKDITYSFIHAPQDVISTRIAKIDFVPIYTGVYNAFSVEKLLPLSEDFASYTDMSAKLSPDATNQQMWLQIPIDYELIYSKDVPISVKLVSKDAGGSTLPLFTNLVQDSTEFNITLAPTLTITNSSAYKRFMAMFRYKFDKDKIYTDEILQSLNGIIHVSLETDFTDSTDSTNYFNEYIDVQFITTRFKIRKKTITSPASISIQAESYSEKATVVFKPPFSSVRMFSIYSMHEYAESQESGQTTQCNFTLSQEKSSSFYGRKKVNRTTTIKNVPVTIICDADNYFDVIDLKITNSNASKDGTNLISQKSVQVGNIKQMDNFAKDMIWRTITNRFYSWITNDLFNWYMEFLANDIYLTYRMVQEKSYLTTRYKSEFMNALLTSDSTYNSQTLLKYAFNYYGQDHTSTNAYSDANLNAFEKKCQYEEYMGVKKLITYSLGQKNAIELQVTFARSEIYDLNKITNFIKEAFVCKYHPEKLPVGYQKSVYGDLGVINTKGKYTYGDHFRLGYFSNDAKYQDKSSDLYDYVNTTGLISSAYYLSDYFCRNITIDFTTALGVELSLTPQEAIELYFDDDTHDANGSVLYIITSLYTLYQNVINTGIKTKRVYSADLSVNLDNITDELFTIYIYPSGISPLYSSFKIKDIKYVYDSDIATVTDLYDKMSLTSEKFNTNEILGTGIKFVCKYLNRSTSEVPIAIMIYYTDEYGYEKTVSLNFSLRARIQLYTASQAANIIKVGTDILKGIWLLWVFDKNSEAIQTTTQALEDSVDLAMANDQYGIGDTAKKYWGGFFSCKTQYYSTFRKYLPTGVLDNFQHSYLERILYGQPTFSQTSQMSMFILPENVEMLESNNPMAKQAEDAIYYMLDTSYKVNQGYSKRPKEWGTELDPYVDYRRVIDMYYNMYLDRLGYDVNLILLPDTTYNISLKTYLVFDVLIKGEGTEAVGATSGFVGSLGGGDQISTLYILQEFLALSRIYPNYEDLLRGIFRDFYVSLNIPRYGRVPSAEHPITITDYLCNQWEADYNTFIDSATMYYFVYKEKVFTHFAFLIPFEKITMSVDTTSTGIFDVNFINFNKTTWSNQFTQVGGYEDLAQSNLGISHQKNKITFSITTPSVIPRKYIDVTVRPLF